MEARADPIKWKDEVHVRHRYDLKEMYLREQTHRQYSWVLAMNYTAVYELKLGTIACGQAGKLVDKLEGADSAALAQKLQRLIGSSSGVVGAGQPTAPPASVQQPPEVSAVVVCRN